MSKHAPFPPISATTDVLDKVRAATDDVDVGFLIYNAGANTTRGNFVELDPQVYRSVININVVGQAEFTRHYGGLMKERGSRWHHPGRLFVQLPRLGHARYLYGSKGLQPYLQ